MASVRPQLTPEKAMALAERLFGLHVTGGAAFELPSYCDRNFLLRCSSPPSSSPTHAVLKVHNSADSDALGLQALEAQTQAMMHMAQAGIACPVPLVSTSGATLKLVELPSSQCSTASGTAHTHVVRCFTYIEGSVLGHAQQVAPCVYSSLGALMARASHALASFHHPGLRRTTAWSFETAVDTIRNNLPAVQGALTASQRSLLEWACDQWQDPASTSTIARLSRQACHGDANEMNILVNEEGTSVMALLDFGDLSETYALAELGVTLTYALLFEIDLEQRRRQQRQQQEQGGQQEQEQQAAAHSRNLHGHCVDASPELRAAMAAGQAVVVGYQQVAGPLSTDERAALPLFVALRVALSLTMGMATAQRDPGNAEYLLMTQRPGWLLLEALKDAAIVLVDSG